MRLTLAVSGSIFLVFIHLQARSPTITVGEKPVSKKPVSTNTHGPKTHAPWGFIVSNAVKLYLLPPDTTTVKRRAPLMLPVRFADMKRGGLKNISTAKRMARANGAAGA
jgi:hypothetical protein